MPDESTKSFEIAGHRLPAPPLAPGLYVVATPIGNLRDVTIRALETLAAADVVLCEDTRHSARLFDAYGMRTPRQPLHEHNERQRMPAIAEAIAGGAAYALISDAGTPLLSDPGFPLVRELVARGLPVFTVPGASALLSALSVAGLPTDAFGFIGFLPPKTRARRNALEPLRPRRDTLCFYESPRRLAETLSDMAAIFGEERIGAVALELTKKFERVSRGTLAELATHFAADETKGEAVILVAGASDEEAAPAAADWQATLASALAAEPLRAAVDRVAAQYKLKRKQVYDAALALRDADGDA